MKRRKEFEETSEMSPSVIQRHKVYVNVLRISRNPAHIRNLSQTSISERFYAFKVKEENLAPNA